MLIDYSERSAFYWPKLSCLANENWLVYRAPWPATTNIFGMRYVKFFFFRRRRGVSRLKTIAVALASNEFVLYIHLLKFHTQLNIISPSDQSFPSIYRQFNCIFAINTCHEVRVNVMTSQVSKYVRVFWWPSLMRHHRHYRCLLDPGLPRAGYASCGL